MNFNFWFYEVLVKRKYIEAALIVRQKIRQNTSWGGGGGVIEAGGSIFNKWGSSCKFKGKERKSRILL